MSYQQLYSSHMDNSTNSRLYIDSYLMDNNTFHKEPEYNIDEYYKYRIETFALETPNGVGILFFSTKNFLYIKEQVSSLLLYTINKNVYIPDDQIINVMNMVFNNAFSSLDELNGQVIGILSSTIRNDLEYDNINKKLDIEVIKYTPDTTMLKTPPIKLREKRYQPFSILRY